MQDFNASRRRLLATGLAAGAAPFLAPCAWAQDTRAIEWVVGFAPGGGSDVVARIVAEAMSRRLGQPMVITNKPGAATNIAADYVARSRNPGHVMLTADFATLATNPFLYGKLSYDAQRDFTSVGMLVRFPLILVVHPDAPYNNFAQWTDWVTAQENGVSYGSSGSGTPHHLAMELLRQRTGLKLTHVPYRGIAPAIQDLLGKQVPVMFVETGGGLPFIRSGKLKPLAVANLERFQELPEVPTLNELGLKGFQAAAWQGLSVPASTPAATVARFGEALRAALQDPAVLKRFQELGVQALPGSAQDMDRFALAERERWGALIKSLNLRID